MRRPVLASGYSALTAIDVPRKCMGGRKARKEARSGRTHEGVHVMNPCALPDAKLRRANPHVAVELRGNDQKGIRQWARLRDLELGQIHNPVRLTEFPTAIPRGRLKG